MAALRLCSQTPRSPEIYPDYREFTTFSISFGDQISTRQNRWDIKELLFQFWPELLSTVNPVHGDSTRKLQAYTSGVSLHVGLQHMRIYCCFNWWWCFNLAETWRVSGHVDGGTITSQPSSQARIQGARGPCPPLSPSETGHQTSDQYVQPAMGFPDFSFCFSFSQCLFFWAHLQLLLLRWCTELCLAWCASIVMSFLP